MHRDSRLQIHFLITYIDVRKHYLLPPQQIAIEIPFPLVEHHFNNRDQSKLLVPALTAEPVVVLEGEICLSHSIYPEQQRNRYELGAGYDTHCIKLENLT